MTFIPNISPFKYSKPEACTLASVTFSPLFRPGRKVCPIENVVTQPRRPPPSARCGAIIFLEAPPQPPNSPKMLSLGLMTEGNFEQQREYVYCGPVTVTVTAEEEI
jgi:hypothetical protein